MQSWKQFDVFGDPVDVLIPSSEARGSFSMIVQTCRPGGGPPPHSHNNEDEIFRTLEGEFEILDGKHWIKLAEGEYAYSLRGNVHTFRNCGTTVGKIQIIITPGRFDLYLETIAPLKMPQDTARLIEISENYGVHFVKAEGPQESSLANNRTP